MQSFFETVQLYWTALQEGQLPELGHWNYLVLSLLIVWQGPVATLMGGAAASAGLLRPVFVFLAGMAGNITADILWYTVGHHGNVDRIVEKGRWLGVRKSHLDRLESRMHRHATKILLLAKISAGFAVPALIAAGLIRIRWRKWFPVVLIGEAVWTGALVMVGFYATEAIKQVEHGLQIFLAVVTFAGLLAIAIAVPRMLRQSQVIGPPTKAK